MIQDPADDFNPIQREFVFTLRMLFIARMAAWLNGEPVKLANVWDF